MDTIPADLIPVEVRWRYDGISHYIDKDKNRFSRIAMLPMEKDELCRYWKICKVEEYEPYCFRIISERDDKK